MKTKYHDVQVTGKGSQRQILAQRNKLLQVISAHVIEHVTPHFPTPPEEAFQQA